MTALFHVLPSTAQVLTGINWSNANVRMREPVRPPGYRFCFPKLPFLFPKNGIVWGLCDFGHGFAGACRQLGQRLCDGPVPALGLMLIPKRGRRRAVAQPRHQLREGGAGQRRQDGTGMAQIMESEILAASSLTGRVKMSVQGRGLEVAATFGRKQQRVLNPANCIHT
jgi:hypothetical protein